MTDRRYNDEEVAAIFLRAAEGPQSLPLTLSRDEGLTLADLPEIGREVGIPPEAVSQAAQAVALDGRGGVTDLPRAADQGRTESAVGTDPAAPEGSPQLQWTSVAHRAGEDWSGTLAIRIAGSDSDAVC